MQQTKTTLTALALGLLASAAVAQTYPAKPVTIVVPYSAGGPVDNFIRALGQQLSDSWKQPVVVLNKPGANEIIGADHVARSAPDGYTLFAGTEASLTMSPHLYKKLPYNVDTDFVPISQLVSRPASTRLRALSGVMPPIATRGTPNDADWASNSTPAWRVPVLLRVGKKAPKAT